MQPDIEQAITFEIKQDIANRYFGFRKLIEEDKIALAEKVRQHRFILEKRISFDLIRIYILLRDKGIIENFLSLIGLNKKLFYDSYLSESVTIRQRVFKGIKLRGLTKKGRHQNALFDCYERLIKHVEGYRETLAELLADHDTISEEIKLFYKNNDLHSILGFMHSLGDTGLSGNMQGGMEPGIAADIEAKLHLAPPSPIDNSLPIMPPLPPLTTIRKHLKNIGNQAFKLHKDDIRRYLSQDR
jgi:hypothetical protein